MDSSKKLTHEINPSIDGLNGLVLKNNESSSFDSYCNNLESGGFYDDLKCFVLKAVINGADKVLKDGKSRKARAKQPISNYTAIINNNTPTSWTNQVGHDDQQCTFKDEEVGQLPFINIISFLAVLAFKFAGFQFNLLIGLFMLPIWLSNFSFMFLMFPFRVMKHVRGHLMKKLVTILAATTVKAQKSMGSMVMRFGSALFWSVYVCSMLLGLLLSGFVFGGVVMRCLVEKPIQISTNLNFDYTKSSPVAYMPLMSSASFGNPQHYIQQIDEKIVSTHTIPYNHKLQLTVSLTVPESEYNRKLGVFQVRVEFLSANGKVTASSSFPCMLQFKSHAIRFAETIIRSVPL
ncbi:seipin-2-like [Carica papaya]|uniref:seipin-2-like n=1 Tax=Carica papaya TaxID=3649 RepID=UPI000B8C910C|nr:seipin-2-like [Carica papaya]